MNPTTLVVDARRMWQGLQTIMDYKGKPSRELRSVARGDDAPPDRHCGAQETTVDEWRGPGHTVRDRIISTVQLTLSNIYKYI